LQIRAVQLTEKPQKTLIFQRSARASSRFILRWCADDYDNRSRKILDERFGMLASASGLIQAEEPVGYASRPC
jgi:hypothetical protein